MPTGASIHAKKQPKQERSRATFDALIEATARILESEGRAGLTTNRIARVAGVSVGSLYQYFPDKQALLDELALRYERELLERLQAVFPRIAQLPLRAAIREFFRFLIDIHRERPRLHNEIARQISDDQQQSVRSAAHAYLEAHRDELRTRDLELTTYIVVEAGESLVHGTALRDPARLADPRFLDEVSDLMERYLVE